MNNRKSSEGKEALPSACDDASIHYDYHDPLLLPDYFPIIVNFELMGWSGIKLSVPTGLIAGIVIGSAVDDTIHYPV